MNWLIVTDSACDHGDEDYTSETLEIARVPFIITVGHTDYVDTDTLDIEKMIDHMEACSELSRTSCPSPGAWYELFEKADKVIAITISEQLSGSHNSAMCAREMIMEKHPEKEIFVLNSLSTGPAMTMLVEKAAELIKNEISFKAVTEKLVHAAKNIRTVFGLSCFDNLMKSGRISKLIGHIAGLLGIWGIGIGSDEGRIVMKGKARGENRAVNAFVEDMKERGYKGGDVFVSHCLNPAMAEKLKNKIKEIWNTARIKIMPTAGLCSFYAERKGLIISYDAE